MNRRVLGGRYFRFTRPWAGRNLVFVLEQTLFVRVVRNSKGDVMGICVRVNRLDPIKEILTNILCIRVFFTKHKKLCQQLRACRDVFLPKTGTQRGANTRHVVDGDVTRLLFQEVLDGLRRDAGACGVELRWHIVEGGCCNGSETVGEQQTDAGFVDDRGSLWIYLLARQCADRPRVHMYGTHVHTRPSVATAAPANL